MKNSTAVKTILFMSGVIALFIGSCILFIPVRFYSLSGIDLGGQVSLLNEVRAPGGSIFACGILLIAGGFIRRLTYTASIVSTLMYLSYGLSRIFSMSLDGMPSSDLVWTMVAEIIIGLSCIFPLIRSYQDLQK